MPHQPPRGPFTYRQPGLFQRLPPHHSNMEAIVLFCRDRARVIARPSTYGELITLAYHIFNLAPGTLSHLVFNYELPGGDYVSAELDQSAYYVVGNGACLGCVLVPPPWANPDPAPAPAPGG